MTRQRILHLAGLALLVCLHAGQPAAMAGESATDSPGNLLINGDFEKWTDGRPDGWVVAEDFKATPSAPGEGYGESGRAVILETTGARLSHFYQYPDHPYQQGRCLRLTVRLKLHEDSPEGAVTLDVSSVDGPPPHSNLMATNRRQVRPVRGEYTEFSVVHQLAAGGRTFVAGIAAEAKLKLYLDKAVFEFIDRKEAEKALEEQRERIQYINPEVPSVELPAYEGKTYEAVVPDTLDMAHRAALAVHGLTGPLDPQADYELYWYAVFRRNPPIMWHNFNDHVEPKFHEALPLMRLASGSHLNEQVDRRWMELMIQMQGSDGLLYYTKIGRPWATARIIVEQAGHPPPGDYFTEPYANARLLAAIGLYYQTTGNERWKMVGQRIVDGLAKQAVDRGDYAYYTKGMYGVNEISDPNAPMPHQWTLTTCGWMAMGLAQFYNATLYEPALALSGKLARCIRYHTGIFQPDGTFVGIGMHFHGHLHPLLGMLEYAIAADDEEMIQFVHKGYQFALTKTSMNTVVGYVPEATGGTFSETCGVADMIHLALKLSSVGAGDYWDDADRWARNQLAENQLTSSDWVREMIKDMPPQPNPTDITQAYCCTEKVPERCLGCFAGRPSPNDWEPPGGGDIMHCCTGNGTRAIYYVWENILHWKDGKLRVNLLLNRASPWADVDSYIPYQGRVDVKVKKECELSVRIPEWVTPQQTQCLLNGKKRPLSFDGRYALVGKVRPKDVATLTFQISERTDVVQIMGKKYTLVRKGNDVVHIDPPGRYCPLYQRQEYRENEARTKKVVRFVARQQINW